MNSDLQSTIDEPDSTELDSDIAAMIADGITQKLVRSHKDDQETIVGMFRCDLDAGQTRYVLNVPIHPALDEVPEVETMVFEDGIRTRITNREKFGVRLELVISNSEHQPKSVYVETVICATHRKSNE